MGGHFVQVKEIAHKAGNVIAQVQRKFRRPDTVHLSPDNAAAQHPAGDMPFLQHLFLFPFKMGAVHMPAYFLVGSAQNVFQ